MISLRDRTLLVSGGSRGVAANALWPRTTIATAATKMLGEAAQALQGHAAVTAVQVQLDTPLNVPL